jgi:hypothetical protein
VDGVGRHVLLANGNDFSLAKVSQPFTSVAGQNRLCFINQWRELGQRLRLNMTRIRLSKQIIYEFKN